MRWKSLRRSLRCSPLANANCAFMLPVGTPPNAIIFATEKLRIVEMVRAGFVMNLIAATLIVLVVYFLMPTLWGLNLAVVPEAFRL